MSERGQLVLVAAVALAAALVPLSFAYLQLGYQAQVEVGSDPVRDARATLQHGLADAVDGIPERFAWADRRRAVTTVRQRLRPVLSALNTSRLDAGTAAAVTYNETRAGEWAGAHCPGGPDRQFGPCRADRGLVVQARAGRTHVLALAVDLSVSGPETDWRATTVVTLHS